MAFEQNTLGELLSNPKIKQIAKDAIRNRDLSQEDLWNKTLRQIKDEYIFFGEIGNGFRCLYRAADSGDWYYPLYSEAECDEDEARRGVNIIRLSSEDPKADERPFIFLVPGGGFMNVWSLTEGWPVADQFNRLGYHVFVLTSPVDTGDNLMKKNMEDFARALKLIREKAGQFHVQVDKYITCGFSAGGYLICLWNTKMGYPAFGLPKPQACFPVYAETSIKETMLVWQADPEDAMDLYGCTQAEAAESEYEIPEHAEGFPPSAIFATATDDLVNPNHSRKLAKALEELSIPCRLEIGPEGGHGFADGTGMCMEGWTERAARWVQSMNN
jgi:acetyl esterase/lipase